MKASLILHHKAKVHGKFIVELRAFDVGKSSRFPDGVKYALICIDEKSGARVLMDNHHPKGHHFHINNDEFPYDYKSWDKLINDFEKLVFDNLGVKL